MRLSIILFIILSFILLYSEEPVFMVTGFDKWGGQETNIAWEGIKHMDSTMVMGYRIHCVKIPVEWVNGLATYMDALARYKPVFVISYGSGFSNACRVEHIAKNIAGHYKDEKGEYPPHPYVKEDGPDTLYSTLPIPEIIKTVNDSVSWARADSVAANGYDAGTYLCNYIFYNLMYYCLTHTEIISAGFIHIVQDTPLDIAERCADLAVLTTIQSSTGFKRGINIKQVPNILKWGKPYPNPSQGFFRLPFTLDRDRTLSFALFDNNGRLVKAWKPQAFSRGNQVFFSSGLDLSTGVYYFRGLDGGRDIYSVPITVSP